MTTYGGPAHDKIMAKEMTINQKLSEISQLGARYTRNFRRLDHDQKREVLDRMDTITAERLRAEVSKIQHDHRISK